MDHIVDDNEADVGDEEAVLRARLEQQERDDKAKSKAIITVVTEGSGALKNLRANKGGISFDELVADVDEDAIRKQLNDDSKNEVEGLDEEELLQRGFQKRKEKEQEERRFRTEFDLSDDDDDAVEEEEAALEELAKSTGDDRQLLEEQRRQRLQKLKLDRQHEKELEMNLKRSRLLRREQ